MSTTETRVITPEAILSFPHLYEPWANDPTQEAKYSASLIFLEGTDISALKAAAAVAGVAKFGDKFREMLEKDELQLPFRTDWEKKGYPEGCTFINVRSKNRPGVVGPYAGEDKRPKALEDPEKMYPGAVVRASITAFGYDRAGKKGVSFGLNNMQWLKDGDRLDSRVAAADDFDAPQGAATPTSGAADLANLL